MINAVALATYPMSAAATRYRLYQFAAPLERRGIRLTIEPFLSESQFSRFYDANESHAASSILRSTVRRLSSIPSLRRADVIIVQREAMIAGPPILEWIASKVMRRPLLLDLDDATWVQVDSPVYGKLATLLKCSWKTDHLIRWAALTSCGSRVIAEYVAAAGGVPVRFPSAVDTVRMRPREGPRTDGLPIVGWIGTHSTFPMLESFFCALTEAGRNAPFRLRIIGSGRSRVTLPGIEVEALDWRLDREVEDFQGLDIGLYPLLADPFTVGKSALKAVQYMAVGIPFVASPVGAAAEVGLAGQTHLVARDHADWVTALTSLVRDPSMRQRMGAAGRDFAVRCHDSEMLADQLAEWIRNLAASDARPGASTAQG